MRIFESKYRFQRLLNDRDRLIECGYNAIHRGFILIKITKVPYALLTMMPFHDYIQEYRNPESRKHGNTNRIRKYLKSIQYQMVSIIRIENKGSIKQYHKRSRQKKNNRQIINPRGGKIFFWFSGGEKRHSE